MSKLIPTTGLAFAILTLAGCSSKILYPRYYTIDIPSPPANGAARVGISGTLAVRRFESAPYIRQKRIVYRPEPEEIGFYEYNRWVDDPAEMVTMAIIDCLRSSRSFSEVKRYDGQNQQDYLMVGHLDRLEETDYGGGVAVTAKISAELVDLHSGITQWTGDAAETLRVDDRNINSVVVEMGHAVQKSIDRLVVSLDQQLVPQ